MKIERGNAGNFTNATNFSTLQKAAGHNDNLVSCFNNKHRRIYTIVRQQLSVMSVGSVMI